MENRNKQIQDLDPEQMDKVSGGTENNEVKPVESSDWNTTEASYESKKKKKKSF